MSNTGKIPGFANWIFNIILPSDDANYLKGDYKEIYSRINEEKGKVTAQFWIYSQIMKTTLNYLIDNSYWSFNMFKNYLKTAYRSFMRNKMLSLINILGLSIGITACLIIIQYVNFEVSYDNFHTNKDNIYRLRSIGFVNGQVDEESADCCAAGGRAVKEAFSEVIEYAKFTSTAAKGIFTYQDRRFREENVFWATNSVFKIFSFNLISGDPATALKDVNSVVISKTTAEKYFNNEDPMGKTIIFSSMRNLPLKVTGVIEDIPENSHLSFDMLLSFPTMVKTTGDWCENSWAYTTFYTYLLLDPEADLKQIESGFPALLEAPNKEVSAEYGFTLEFRLQPLKDIHLKSNYIREAEQNGDERSVYILSAIALFIIVIAWINYVNLSTAKSISRSREVGIRKVVGALRRELTKQFLLEFLLLNLIAMGISFILLFVSLPFFNEYTGLNMNFTLWESRSFWIASLIIFFLGAFISGLYPSIFLSSFNPVSILKGKSSGSQKGKLLRKSLVVFQFAASTTLIIGTIVVYKQLTFITEKDLGVSTEQTLILKGASVIKDKSQEEYFGRINTFRAELLSNPNIKNISLSTFVPGESVWLVHGARIQNAPIENSVGFHILGIDHQFSTFYDLEIIAGRNFMENMESNNSKVLINENSASALGFNSPEEAIGKILLYREQEVPMEIIGVVKNYNQETLKEGFEPLLFMPQPVIQDRCSIKLDTGNIGETISHIKSIWEEFYPGNPFDYYFLDDSFNNLYMADLQFGKIFSIFAIFAIFIACLGLFGLASLSAVQRTKEIGIRKTLGASAPAIINLFTGEFILLVIIGNIISWPIAYYIMKKWLDGFAFHTIVGVIPYITAGLLSIAIAYLAISSQAYKTSRKNPVDSLRYE